MENLLCLVIPAIFFIGVPLLYFIFEVLLDDYKITLIPFCVHEWKMTSVIKSNDGWGYDGIDVCVKCGKEIKCYMDEMSAKKYIQIPAKIFKFDHKHKFHSSLDCPYCGMNNPKESKYCGQKLSSGGCGAPL